MRRSRARRQLALSAATAALVVAGGAGVLAVTTVRGEPDATIDQRAAAPERGPRRASTFVELTLTALDHRDHIRPTERHRRRSSFPLPSSVPARAAGHDDTLPLVHDRRGHRPQRSRRPRCQRRPPAAADRHRRRPPCRARLRPSRHRHQRSGSSQSRAIAVSFGSVSREPTIRIVAARTGRPGSTRGYPTKGPQSIELEFVSGDTKCEIHVESKAGRPAHRGPERLVSRPRHPGLRGASSNALSRRPTMHRPAHRPSAPVGSSTDGRRGSARSSGTSRC